MVLEKIETRRKIGRVERENVIRRVSSPERKIKLNDKQKNRSNQTDTQQQTWRNVLLSLQRCFDCSSGREGGEENKYLLDGAKTAHGQKA